MITGLHKTTDAERFTNAFLVGLVRARISHIRVHRSDGLPQVQTIFGETVESDFTKVMNRLKVCSMLDPVAYTEPVVGSFELFCPGEDAQVEQFKVEVCFNDREPDPCFEVRFERTAS